MATYSKKKLLAAHPSQINSIAEAIQNDFVRDGFEVKVDTLMSGGKDISITKGNLFKAVLGMRSALKVTLIPQTDGILFDANVGIYGQQAIPTVISMLFFWPVLITQIWGLVVVDVWLPSARSRSMETMLLASNTAVIFTVPMPWAVAV